MICYIVVGYPGAGKTTWIKNNLKNIKVLEKDQIIKEYLLSNNIYNENCNFDDLQQNNITDDNYLVKLFSQLSNEQHKEINNIFNNLIKQCCQNNEDFVIDHNNIGNILDKRLEIIKQFKNIKIIGINIKTPIEVCHNRRQWLSIKSYEKMSDNIRYLTLNDVDEIINIEYNK